MENSAILKIVRSGWFFFGAAFLLVFILVAATQHNSVFAKGWIIYYDSAYRGRVIDTETGQPIEGAVVVAIYRVRQYGIADSGSSVADVKEVLTDKTGAFHIPSHIFFHCYPFSSGEVTTFMVFKPGYASLYDTDLKGILSFHGKEKVELPWIYNQGLKFVFAPGLVGLPKVSDKEERLKAIPGSPGFTTSRDLPLLYRAINEENKNFGLGEVK
jgi:hypothetical protein